MRTFHSLLSCSLLLGALSAQDATYRFVPADYEIVFRISGPAKWRTTFAGTPVAQLLELPALAPMLAKLEAAMEEDIEELRGEGKDEEAELTEQMLRSYGGEIVVGIDFDLDLFVEAMMTDETPPVAVVVSMGPDGSTDLGKLAELIAESMADDEETLSTPTTTTVGGHSLQLYEMEEGVGVMAPTLIEGHLVTVFGPDLERRIGDAIGDTPRYQGGNAAGVLQMSFSARAFIEVLEMAIDEEAELPVDLGAILGALGLQSMDRLELSFGAEDKRVVGDFALSFLAGDRGVFDLIKARGAKPQKLLPLIPHDATQFSVSGVDIGAMYGLAKKVFGVVEDIAPMSFDDAMSMFHEETGVRLKEDLLDHLGNEALVLQQLEETFDTPDGTMCLGITLRNGTAFDESLERVLKGTNGAAARKTEEYEGVKVHRFALGGVIAIEYAVAPDLLLVAIGSNPGEQLRGVLTQRAAKSTDLAPSVKAALAAVGNEPWTALGGVDLGPFLTLVSAEAEREAKQPKWNSAVGLGSNRKAEEEADREVVAALRAIAQEVKRLGFVHLLSWTTVDDSRVRARYVWGDK